MTTWGQAGSPPLLARMIGWTSVLTTSTSKPMEPSRSDTNFCAPLMPSLNLESVETLGKRMNSFSFSTASNIRTPCGMRRCLPIPKLRNPSGSVPEMPDPRKHHGDAALVRRLDDLGVADRSPRLDGRRGARLRGRDQAVREWKQRLASPAFQTAMRELSTRDIWPAPIPSVRSPRQ